LIRDQPDRLGYNLLSRKNCGPDAVHQASVISLRGGAAARRPHIFRLTAVSAKEAAIHQEGAP